MSLYRCAACGSPNVVKHEQKDGFSYKKAIAGTVVFGAIGAVAGIDGKTKEDYTCPDCGATLPEPMDSITQAKIDSVMIAPETLVPMVFPDMYQRFAYLRKEIDQRRAKANEETFARLTNVSNVQQNPLNVSEDEFRQSAKEVNGALIILAGYLRYYYEKQGMPNFESGEMIGIDESHKFIPSIKHVEFISQSLLKMKNVVYALSCYRHLIHNEYGVDDGLNIHDVSMLLFTYVMMELDECTCEEFYYYVNNNAMLKQAFTLIIKKEYYDRKIRDELRTYELLGQYNHEISEERMMEFWFECMPCPYPAPVDFKSYDTNEFKHLMSLKNWTRSRQNESSLRCRIRLSANTLYFINLEDPEKLFEKTFPELALQIKSKKEAVEQTQKRYEELTTDQPSSEEQNKARQISANQASIQELQKVKLFGKKKALAKAEDLAKENERLNSQIEALKVARIQENKKASEEIRKQLETMKKELAELQITMDDFMSSVRWIPVQ